MTNLLLFGALGAYAAVGLIVGTVAGGQYARDWSADEPEIGVLVGVFAGLTWPVSILAAIVAYAVCSTSALIYLLMQQLRGKAVIGTVDPNPPETGD